MQFYEALSKTGISDETWMHTVASGDRMGEKAVVSGGGFIWISDAGGFLAHHTEDLLSVSSSGVTDVDGVKVYSEHLGRERKLVICGAGHVSMQVISIGKMLGFHVTAIDDRLQFADNAIRQGADEVIFKSFEEALKEVAGDEDTYFVIVTRGHRYDRECLKAVTQKPHAYIGMMGSRRRVILVKNELEEEGIAREILDSVYTPIGLKIGAETPEEIAVSIMAEIIEVSSRKKRSQGFSAEILDALMAEGREPVSLATIIAREGSAPRGIGTKMLIRRDGGITGTIGGGCIEGSVIAKGRRMLSGGEHKPAVVEVDMSSDTAEDEGMVCGGRVTVLIETV